MSKTYDLFHKDFYFTQKLERVDDSAMSPSVLIIRKIHRTTKTEQILYRLNGLYAFAPIWKYRHFFMEKE